MTGKDYNRETIDIFERMAADEWENPTLSVEKILSMTREYYKFLDNSEIANLNKAVRSNPEILAAEKAVRDLSSKASKDKGDSFKKMMENYKKAVFLQMQIVSNYVFLRYISPLKLL